MSKKKAKYPRMVYHPKTGDYAVVNSEAEIPKGFVNDVKKVEGYNPRGTTEMKRADLYIDPAPVEDDDKEDGEGSSDPITLESLELTRKEALALLKDAGIKHAKNIKGDDLAALVAENFADDDDEDDEDDDSE